MTNQNACVTFFERRNTDANNKNTDNDNLRAVKYSICVLEQYKNLLRLQDQCNNTNIVYDPKNIDFLQKAYDTIRNAEVQEPDSEVRGRPKPLQVLMVSWNGDVTMNDTVTFEDQNLVSNSLDGFATFCQNYSQGINGDECAKGSAYNKCINVMNNAAAFWNRIDKLIPATFEARDLSQVCQ